MNHPHLTERWTRIERRAWIVALIGAVLIAIAVLTKHEAFYRSYLMAYLYWWGISAGALGLAMLHNLTGGKWGEAIRAHYSAAVDLWPLMALLFIPVGLGLEDMYIWAQPDIVAHDPILQDKALYLNREFWIGRAIGYFALWVVLGLWVTTWSRRIGIGAPRPRGLQRLCAIGLVLLVTSVSFAAIDWIMSLEPHWFSTMFGAWICIGALVSGMAMMIASLLTRADWYATDPVATPEARGDLGNLMLAFVMLWAYFSFSQYLIIWAGNLPEETIWYLERIENGWLAIALVMVVFHFFAPFIMLLSRDLKRHPRLLPLLAVGLLVVHGIDWYWIVAPSFESKIYLHWPYLALMAGIGGLWMALYSRRVRVRLAQLEVLAHGA